MQEQDTQNQLEFWMRGPFNAVPALLQPVAHALLQMQYELSVCLESLDSSQIWLRPKDAASVGFHTLHIIGVIDRMFTYAANKSLTEQQFSYLKSEGQKHEDLEVSKLVEKLEYAVSAAISKLKNVDESQLTEVRYLGRKRLEVTLIGLLFHAAEHSMRHLGQALVTAKMVR